MTWLIATMLRRRGCYRVHGFVADEAARVTEPDCLDPALDDETCMVQEPGRVKHHSELIAQLGLLSQKSLSAISQDNSKGITTNPDFDIKLKPLDSSCTKATRFGPATEFEHLAGTPRCSRPFLLH